jgi:signal peptidase II
LGAANILLLRTGLSLIFGGAVGNLWDRLLRGTVTDFLQFFFGSYEFPSFNVADSAITVGAALLLLDLWHSSRKAALSTSEPRP